MVERAAHRRSVYVLVAILLAAITLWGASTGVALHTDGLAALAAAFFAGGAISRIRDAIPQYERVGLAVLGLVAAGTLALGTRSELAVALVIVGAGSAIDAVRVRARGNPS